MKTIAEQEAEKKYPDFNPKYKMEITLSANRHALECRTSFIGAYNLASEHWAAFMEWASKNDMLFMPVSGEWWDNRPTEKSIIPNGKTTTELFQYWFENVKDK